MISNHLVTLIEEGQFAEAENDWLARVEAGQLDIDEFLLAAKAFGRQKEKDRAILLMGLLSEELKAREQWSDLLRVLRELVRHTPEPGKLQDIREDIIKTLRKVYPNRPSFSQVLRNYSFEDLTNGPDIANAVHHIIPWLARDVGEVVYREGYGVGKIKEINLKLNLLRVDFETKKDITVDVADQEMESLEPGNILRETVDHPDKVRQMDPQELLGEVLRALGKPVSVGQLKEALAAAISADQWTKWWTAAKKNLLVATSGKGAQATYSIGHSTLAIEESLQHEFDESKLPAKIAMARQYAGRTAELSEHFAQALIAEANAAYQQSRWIDALELAEMFEKWPGSGNYHPAYTLDDVVRSADIPALLKQMDNTQLKLKVLSRIRELMRDRWNAIFTDAFLKDENPKVLEYVYGFFSEQEQQNLLERINSHAFLHPGAFSWIAQTAAAEGSMFEAMLDGKFLINVLTAIDEPEFSSHRTRLKKALESGLLMNVLRKSIPGELAQKAIERLEHTDKIEEYRKERWKGIIRVHVPQTKEKIDYIFSTKEGFERKRSELEQLISVELPKNRKAVGEAAAHGDLKENHEYKAARERQDYLINRIQQLQEELRRVRVLDPAQIDPGEVRPGTRVVLKSSPEKEMTVTILGPWDSNPTEGIYSFEAPFSKNLLGKTCGEKIDWQGESWTIESIEGWISPQRHEDTK